MSNVVLAWPNWLDTADSIGGGSWQASLPASNIGVRARAVVARSTNADAASTVIDVDFGVERWIGAVDIAGQNLSPDATVQITFGTSAGGSQIYDSEPFPAWALDFDDGSQQWQQYNWWEPVAADEYVGAPFDVIHTLSANLQARYMRVRVVDEANPAGYVQLARLFAGYAWSPGRNASFPLAHGYDARDERARLESGGFATWRRRAPRTARISLEMLRPAEVAALHEFMRRVGTGGELLYVPDPGDASLTQRCGFLAVRSRADPMPWTTPVTFALPIELIEDL